MSLLSMQINDELSPGTKIAGFGLRKKWSKTRLWRSRTWGLTLHRAGEKMKSY